MVRPSRSGFAVNTALVSFVRKTDARFRDWAAKRCVVGSRVEVATDDVWWGGSAGRCQDKRAAADVLVLVLQLGLPVLGAAALFR